MTNVRRLQRFKLMHSRFQSLTGDVEGHEKDSNAWRVVHEGEVLSEGFVLRTGADSRALIASKKSRFVLGPSTILEVKPSDKLSPSPIGPKSGTLYFFSREHPKDIQIRTPTVSTAIRG
jgi:hypothetical protein